MNEQNNYSTGKRRGWVAVTALSILITGFVSHDAEAGLWDDIKATGRQIVKGTKDAVEGVKRGGENSTQTEQSSQPTSKPAPVPSHMPENAPAPAPTESTPDARPIVEEPQATPEPASRIMELRYAVSSDQIARLQNCLNQVGRTLHFSAGPADGVAGAKTDEAMRIFIESYDHHFDGTVNQRLVDSACEAARESRDRAN